MAAVNKLITFLFQELYAPSRAIAELVKFYRKISASASFVAT
jgi:hypothetical protein